MCLARLADCLVCISVCHALPVPSRRVPTSSQRLCVRVWRVRVCVCLCARVRLGFRCVREHVCVCACVRVCFVFAVVRLRPCLGKGDCAS